MRRNPRKRIHPDFRSIVKTMTILVTGGCGYIGSHVSVRLLQEGHDVRIIDNLSNARPDVAARIAEVSPRAPSLKVADVTDRRALAEAVADIRIDGVVHLAGRKAVEESVFQPLTYYRTNVAGTLNVREVSRGRPFVFSSSATVYGVPAQCPIDEEAAIAPVNPYGASKAMAERMLLDAAHAPEGDRALTILRYFNPIGAHPSGRLGDDPLGMPKNLLPSLERVARGAVQTFTVHGRDYATRDGTAIRDYVHVVDLADAHAAALARTDRQTLILNLGSSQGFSVLEVVSAFERAAGLAVPLTFGPRRAGDVPVMWANAARARDVIDWQPRRTLDEACVDAWRWQLERRSRDAVAKAA
jgi:UDP-glucose 4-epimerase